MKPLKNKIAEYLKKRDWEWVTEQQIISATGCTTEDLKDIMQDPVYMRMIETTDIDGIHEYRYISNIASHVRQAVVYLKSQYPRWISTHQIGMAVNVCNAAGILSGYVDIAPIEKRYTYINRQRVTQYRYVFDDKRSLQDRVFAGYVKPGSKHKIDVFSVFQKHPREWLTAKQIGNKMHVSGGCLSAALNQLVKEKKIDHKTYSKRGVTKKLYCYFEVTA